MADGAKALCAESGQSGSKTPSSTEMPISERSQHDEASSSSEEAAQYPGGIGFFLIFLALLLSMFLVCGNPFAGAIASLATTSFSH